jgi:hypothetical protein
MSRLKKRQRIEVSASFQWKYGTPHRIKERQTVEWSIYFLGNVRVADFFLRRAFSEETGFPATFQWKLGAPRRIELR